MESLKKMDDELYNIVDGIDEALAYLDDIAIGWLQGREIDLVRIDRCKEELIDARRRVCWVDNSVRRVQNGEELEK